MRKDSVVFPRDWTKRLDANRWEISHRVVVNLQANNADKADLTRALYRGTVAARVPLQDRAVLESKCVEAAGPVPHFPDMELVVLALLRAAGRA